MRRERTPPDGHVDAPERDVAPSPAQTWLAQWRRRAWWRWRTLVVVEACIWGAGVGLIAHAATAPLWLAMSLAGAVCAARAFATPIARDVTQVLHAAETGRRPLGNALVTWHEIDRGLLAAPAMFRERLAAQATAALDGAPWPTPRDGRAWSVAVLVLTASVVAASAVPWLARPRTAATTVVADPASTQAIARPALSVSFVVTPPAYTGRPPVSLDAAEMLDVLVGSTVRAQFVNLPRDASVHFGGEPLPVEASFDVVTSGLLVVGDASGTPLLTTAIHAIEDRAPIVRVVAPGRDIRTSDVTQRLPLDVDASDDLALTSLRVRYTKVSGSGETFEFQDGELPVEVSRGADRWRARGVLDLAALGLAPGDTLVYWAVARDGRLDDRGRTESERFLVEIPRPGALAAGDFSLPEPEHRYALSQRMVILLTERLLERRSRMAPEEVVQEALGLAVQQRRVRAEFVFLMGGEVVDEVEEAEHSHEVEAGRLDNSGQQELLEAVRQMAQAEQRLTDADLEAALPFEYRALNALQAAFGKARYFMRTLPATVAIDQTRRGSGDLSLAQPASWVRMPLPPGRVADGRHALDRLTRLTPQASAADVATTADALLALDRDRPDWLRQVQRLTTAFRADGLPADRRRAIESITDALRLRLAEASPDVLPLRLAVTPAEVSVATAAAGASR